MPLLLLCTCHRERGRRDIGMSRLEVPSKLLHERLRKLHVTMELKVGAQIDIGMIGALTRSCLDLKGLRIGLHTTRPRFIPVLPSGL